MITVLSMRISGSCFHAHWHEFATPPAPFRAHGKVDINGVDRALSWELEYEPDYLHLVPEFDFVAIGLTEVQAADLHRQAEAMVDAVWGEVEGYEAEEGEVDVPVTWSTPAFLSLSSSTS